MFEEDTPPEQDGLLSLSDLAKLHGHLAKHSHPAEDGIFDGPHMVADIRHGWSKRKHFKGEETRLTSEDYLEAIKAAQENKSHAPADFRPAKEAPPEEPTPKKKKKGGAQ